MVIFNSYVSLPEGKHSSNPSGEYTMNMQYTHIFVGLVIVQSHSTAARESGSMHYIYQGESQQLPFESVTLFPDMDFTKKKKC